ncbi:Fatty acyl-CoA hydrolase precursor, medium chain [Leucoagaricus sp. SymC.cos]|nr:Fatty acyl-CoA hydrolase precursor, medium chain [Leucoagaricus sp. SymC.cos]
MRCFHAVNVLSTVSAVCAASPAPVVDLGYAKYQGHLNNQFGTMEYLGIRYAAAPTGPLRWREPRPPQPTSGVQMADKNAHACYEGHIGISPTNPLAQNSLTRRDEIAEPTPSEDCLFLNVFTPSSYETDLPVVVWIHGGGYLGGNAYQYEGSDLVQYAGDGAIAVVIQYRLGIFGFLSGQKVHDGGVLNAGLFDQQFALQWVQDHISKFGGDPAKVTIWGQSAGSSTYLPPQYIYNHRIPEKIFADVVTRAGCSSSKDALDCLRQADIATLSKVNLDITQSAFFGTCILVPVVDGTLITKRPTELLKEVKINGGAFLSMTNSFEGTAFVDNTTVSRLTTAQYLANMFPGMTKQRITDGVKVYESAGLGGVIEQARAIMSEAIFVCPTYFLLKAVKGRGFKGEFAVPPALHADNLAYYFANSPVAKLQTPPFANVEFANDFSQLLMNFVLSLDPNVKWDSANTTPDWPKWSEDRREEMVFNRTSGVVGKEEPMIDVRGSEEGVLSRCAYWESVTAPTAQ